MQVELEVRRDGEAPRRVTVGTGVVHMGRAPDNDVVLPDVGVSRRHARLVVRAGSVLLEDLGSGNGTFLRGERVGRHMVADGDQVVIDPFVLILRLQPDAVVTADGEEETALVDHALLAQASESARRARLVVIAGHGLARSYALTEAGLTMGRSDDRDIVMQDPAASRMQAEVRPADDVFWLRDFGSANGTFVNGRRVRERPLQHGDRIRVGSTEFRFELTDVGAGVVPVPGASPAAAPVAATPVIPSPAAMSPAAATPAALTPAAVTPAAVTPVTVTPAAVTPAAVTPAAATPVLPGPVIATAAVGAPIASAVSGGPGLGGISPAAAHPPPVAQAVPPPQARGRSGVAGVLIGVFVALVVLGGGATVLGLVLWWQLRAGDGEAETVAQAETAETAEVAAGATVPADDAAAAGQPTVEAIPEEASARSAAAEPPAADAATADAATADAANPAEDNLMGQGMALFREGAYLEATARFYQALKAQPDNVEAERMCYVSCEFLALQQLRDDVRQRQVSPEEREALYTEAVRVGRRAARGRGNLDAAEQAIIAALEWYPSDGTLVELQESIQARRARSPRASTATTTRSSSSSTSASDRRLARQYLDEGLQAIDDGRFVVARDRLARAASLDSSLSSARSNLTDVDRVLEDRARTAWSQGQALEAAGNSSAAVTAYEQVVTYASSRQGDMKRGAEQRLAALR